MHEPHEARKVHQFPLVRSYMTPATHTISPAAPLADGLALMRAEELANLPVCTQGQVAGLLTLSDAELATRLGPGAGAAVVAVMRGDLLAVTPDAPLAEVVDEMAQRKLRAAIIVEDGRCVGVFSSQDAVVALRELLSEPD